MLGAAEVRDLLDRHGLAARRSLGQNFVADPNTVRRIARLAGVGEGDRVVEVGPGLGSLTLALVETGAEVVAVEKDDELVPVLREVLAAAGADGVRVVHGDALTVDWQDLTGGDPAVVVANLPYNVAVPVVLGVLERAPEVARAVVMVQREVAERLAAGPGGRTIGVPTVKLGWWASARIVASVGPEVFVPRPRVDSAVLEVVRHDPPSTLVGPHDVFPLVERAYHQRRKMLRATLGRTIPVEVFEAAGIAPTDRPEVLEVADWVRLAEAVRAAGAT